MNKRIFLIGPMAAGKSTVGKKLSELLQFEFLDTDLIIAKEQGCSMHDIFTKFDEAYFRKLEADVLNRISTLNNIIVATGGGCILNAITREVLAASGIICYLKVNIEQQMQRLANDDTRPTLPVEATLRLKFLEQSFMQREQLYNSISDINIDTSALTAHVAAHEIFTLLRDVHAYN